MKCYMIEAGNSSATHFGAFGVFDEKGREIGAKVFIRNYSYVPVDQSNDTESYLRCTYDAEPGPCYAMEPHATRDGFSYGAGQHMRLFKTAEERTAAIDKYFAEARKRAYDLGANFHISYLNADGKRVHVPGTYGLFRKRAAQIARERKFEGRDLPGERVARNSEMSEQDRYIARTQAA